MEFLAALERAGFVDVERMGETGFNSSPKTKGVLFRARKPMPQSPEMEVKKTKIRPMMEACGIDVFKTARRNGFQIDTRKEIYGEWSFFAMVLIE